METNFDKFEARLCLALGGESLYTWAGRVAIKKPAIASMLKRRALPKVELLTQMATALGCSLDWLLGVDGQAPALPPAGALDALIQAELAAAMEQLGGAMKARLRAAAQAGLAQDEQALLAAYRLADARGKQVYLGLAAGQARRQNGL